VAGRYDDRNPVQHIEDQHRGRSGQCQEQLAAPEPGDPAEFREIDQPERGEHHQGTKGGQWKGRERRTEEQHGEQHNCGGDKGVQLSAAAHRVADHRTTAATADWKTGEQPRTEVGRT
jgi:hypothetical protein